MPKSVVINTLKIGDYFTAKSIENPKDSEVWVFDGYNRFTKKYSGHKFNDISRFRDFSASTHVYINFTF
jgi:hypothetical protein